MNIFDLQATITLNSSGFEAGIQNAQSAMRGFSSGIGAGAVAVGNIVADMATTAASGLMDFGKDAVTTGMNFDAAMSNVQAVSGATAEEFDALRASAMYMGATTQFTATQAAEAFSYMGMAGWDASQMLSGISGIMNLAAASGEDLATTSDIVTDALTAFGLNAEDAGHFADILAAASAAANTNVGLMGETFKYVAPLAGTMGYSIEDMATAIGTMANSGIKGSQAGTVLRAAISRLVKPTKDVTEGLAMLGLDGGIITDADGNVRSFADTIEILRDAFSNLTAAEQTEIAAKLFGQEAMSGMLAIINTSAEDYNALADTIAHASDAMDGQGAAAEMAGIQLDNLKGDITILNSALDGFKTAVYDKIKEPLRDAAQGAADAMSSLTDAINTGDIAGAFAAIGAAAQEGIGSILDSMGPVGDVIGSAAGAVGDLLSAFQSAASAGIEDTASAVQAFINAFSDSDALGSIERVADAVKNYLSAFASSAASVIEGVASATASFLSGFANSGGADAIASISAKIADFFAAFINAKADIMESVGGWVRDFLSAFPSEEVGGIIGGIAAKTAEFFSAFSSVMAQMISDTAAAIGTFLDGFQNDAVGGIIQDIAQWVGDLFGHFSEGFAGIVTRIGDAFSGFAQKLAELWNAAGPDMAEAGEAIHAFLENASRAAEDFFAVVQPVAEWLTSALSVAIEAVMETIVIKVGAAFNAVSDVVAAIQLAFGGFVDLLHGDVQGAIDGFKAAWENIKEFFGELGEFLAAPFRALKDVLGDEANKGVEALKKPFEAVVGWFTEIGTRIVDGIKSGISSAWGSLTSFIADACNNLVDGVFSLFKINSPSKVFAEIGSGLVEGMQKGWADRFDMLERQVMRDSNRITDTVRTKFEDSAIGRSSTAGINTYLAAANNQARGGTQTVNVVLDSDVIASAIYGPLQRENTRRGGSGGTWVDYRRDFVNA